MSSTNNPIGHSNGLKRVCFGLTTIKRRGMDENGEEGRVVRHYGGKMYKNGDKT